MLFRATVVLGLLVVSVPIATEWTPPQRGWLYVLDSNDGGEKSEVLLVNPADGKVHGRIKTGYDPDIALSADGTRLFLIHDSDFFVIDTASAQVVRTTHVPNLERYIMQPGFTRPVLLNEDTVAYVAVQLPRHDGCREGVAAVEIESGHLFESNPDLPDCFGWQFLRNGNELVLVGGSSDEIHIVDGVGDRGFSQTFFRANTGRLDHAGAIPFKDTLVLASADGRLTYVDLRTRQVTRSVTDLPRVNLKVGSLVSAGGKLFLAAGETKGGGFLNQILILDAASGKLLGSIHSDQLLWWNLTPSADGARLYAPTKERSVAVFDTESMRQIQTIPNMGRSPGRVLVVP